MKKAYVSIGNLVQDLQRSYSAALLAIRISNKLKNKNNLKWRKRSFSLLNKIRGELKIYEKQLSNGFTVISYSGCIVSKYLGVSNV